ncbi:MAG: transposase family protein, partial [Sulfobacillus sp.]
MRRPAQYRLSAVYEAPPFQEPGRSAIDVNQVPLEGTEGRLAGLAHVTDPRKKRGIRHSQTTILAIAVCAVLLSGSSFWAMADWARSLPQYLLKRSGLARNDDLIERVNIGPLLPSANGMPGPQRWPAWTERPANSR